MGSDWIAELFLDPGSACSGAAGEGMEENGRAAASKSSLKRETGEKTSLRGIRLSPVSLPSLSELLCLRTLRCTTRGVRQSNTCIVVHTCLKNSIARATSRERATHGHNIRAFLATQKTGVRATGDAVRFVLLRAAAPRDSQSPESTQKHVPSQLNVR